MILVVTATEMEFESLRAYCSSRTDVRGMVCGVGVMEACLNLARKLCGKPQSGADMVQAVVNIGIGGAYLQPAGCRQPELLDICIAEREILGDIGVWQNEAYTPLPPEFGGGRWLELEPGHGLHELAREYGQPCHFGNFVTVSGVSGTAARGEELRSTWNGLCENMEGAGLARVCAEFGIRFFEIRAVSNLVVDRDRDGWKVKQAAEQAAEFGTAFLESIIK